ncbi:glycosyltransferase [Arthrobacter sp. SLBN-112]|uniref:glycosyltransferase family 2 protein n=1 Tax=Arthrobacter sp. SLBN-112 TaxID=2768452 RepID=UPI0027B40657|nr:glycosyltransferase [Arthrobacter sp. SLBN-112]MDQ0800632.1 glycosyltransferase involved in cell wall biosynthesis [Arthrobacter sp. SLBN-112]
MPDTSLDIFIPYWGDPGYMKLAVDSILGQTNPRWRLTVVDDAYPDSTIADYVSSLDDSRITFIKKKQNEGITASFRTSLRRAEQDLVCFVGCDDYLLPDYVETILQAHREFPEADIIQPGVTVIDADGKPSKTLVDRVKQRLLRPRSSAPLLLSGEKLATSLLHGDWLYWPSLTFKTSSVRDFDFRNEFPIIQDLALVIDMIVEGHSLLVVPEKCFAYRRHSDSASSVLIMSGSRFQGERDYFALAAELTRAKGWRRAELAARLRLTSRAHALSLVPVLLKTGDAGAFRTMVRHGLGA